LDLEADGFHRYPEHVSLIQLALPEGPIQLLDPLALEHLEPLGGVLAEPTVEKVFHSADYDLRSLDRDFDFHVNGLYDTAIAARFCGSERTGLANVLGEHLDLQLDKPKRLQRLDWSLRPLDATAIAYAAADVAHLLMLADTLAQRLADLGRTAWVAEECRRLEGVRYTPPAPPEQSFLTVPGARKLTGRGLAVLRELYVFREHEARRIGRPPYRVMSNSALLSLAEDPPPNLKHVRGVGRRTLARAGRRLEAALRRGVQADPVYLPHRRSGNPWTPEARHRLAALKEWRSGEAERLGLDTGTVWPAAHLKQAALFPGTDSAALDEGKPPWVRQWQWGELGESFARFRRERGLTR